MRIQPQRHRGHGDSKCSFRALRVLRGENLCVPVVLRALCVSVVRKPG